MTKLLLSIHVVAAIVAIGPVTVAASMFPAALRRGDTRTMRTLLRICRVYAALAVVVPVFGVATAASLGVLTDAWLLTSIALTVAAGALLGLRILPAQAAAAESPAAAREAPAMTEGPARPGDAPPVAREAPAVTDGPARPGGAPAAPDGPVLAAARRLGMLAGVFNLLWTTVVVLMIVRPGSTTGA